ncbi:YebC/PmpR family DNA-binding transcriptional regulator [Candidatus Magnetominusculus xianensis]|uniref:Probable transcriptional regulatory protein ASN18_0783 n=1 Tax=Candidatus Magnetominusculus xianensis TaxID=1748249 RepID=A0ABR5SIX0_9BACT|nr:YebC/PmpR family DNA-binding transcriptional regulator [Candidatus Magnetominusculus xianensis]KWT91665.1 putative transcriptional regulatory protein [Candidatus Magnetominusculus xianensis]MBF0404578.1 YebC/PmpR family DNA-binding transcriptional regulator [Nitrospirota bacterium]
MSGHSKWAQIKRKKAVTDSRKGKVFSRIVKEVSVAARMGGSDPEGNPRLRTAIDKAKEVNMPLDNIKRAIQKGAGELGGAMYEEIIYEGYGPGGVAVLIEAMTDNKNRTVAEIRYALTKHGGTLGESGCVAWMFSKKGCILIDKKAVSEDTLMTEALEAGVDDLKNDPNDDMYELITTAEDMAAVKAHLEKASIAVSSSEITMIPGSYIQVDDPTAQKMMRIIDALDELEDVQNVHVNFDLPGEEL